MEDNLKGFKTNYQSIVISLEEKTDTILQFTESMDETVTNHEKRITRVETVPIIVHEIRKKSK